MKLKRFITLLLALALVVGLLGCTGSKTDTFLVGEWKGRVDLSALLSEFQEEEFSDLDLSDIGFDIVFFFENDNRFQVLVDKYSVTVMIDTLIDRILDLHHATEEKKAELRSQLETAIDKDALASSVESSFQSGYYVRMENTIYLSSNLESLLADPKNNRQEEMCIRIENDKLTITDMISQTPLTKGTIADILPITMEKQ